MNGDAALEYDLLQKGKKLKEYKAGLPVRWSFLVTVAVATGLITVAELLLAQITHCISLLVLSYQNIYNVLTLLMTLVAKGKGNDPVLGKTFGWRRMEVVGSIVSLVFLFSLCFATFIEALQTVFHNGHLDTFHHPSWIMGALGGQVAVWAVSYLTIGGYSHHQTRAVSQGSIGTQVADIGRDLLGVLFTSVIVTIIHFKVITDDFAPYLDPVISILYIITLIWTCVPLVRDSCLILLQTIPGNVEVALLKKFILQKFPGIISLHEVHVWTLTPKEMVLTAHVTYKNKEVYREIHTQVTSFFSSQGFSWITLQPEFLQENNRSRQESSSCIIACKGSHCNSKACCNGDDSGEISSSQEGDQEMVTFLE